MKKLTTIDLFAGAGGLSHGFLKTGMFDIKLAIENNKYAQITYEKNHPGVKLCGDINDIDFNELISSYGQIDVIIGGPPCQGFSNANRQKNYLVSPKNQLIKKYIEAVELLNPSIVVMENVKNIISEKHKFLYSNNDKDTIDKLNLQLRNEKIILGSNSLKPLDFLEFLNNLSESSLQSYFIPEAVFICLKQLYKKSGNIDKFKDYYGKNATKIQKIISRWDLSAHKFWCEKYRDLCNEIRTIITERNYKLVHKKLSQKLCSVLDAQMLLHKVSDLFKYDVYCEKLSLSSLNEIVLYTKSYKIIDYIKSKLCDLGYNIDSGILNAADFGVPQLRQRFILIGVRSNKAKNEVTLPSPKIKKKAYLTIGDCICDLENYSPRTNMDDYVPFKLKSNFDCKHTLCDSEYIYNHITTDTRKTALERFKILKPGQNFHDLTDNLKTTYTTPSKTQNTIYKRLNYDLPSDTVVNVRKSMWIHPTKNRAISIREAARLQSFPDSFIFYGTKDSQYQQIGNAVPPLLSQAIAERIITIVK